MSRKTQFPLPAGFRRLTVLSVCLAMLIPLAGCGASNAATAAGTSYVRSAISASAVGARAVSDADLPEYLVNGDFSYPGAPWGGAWNIWPDTGQYATVDNPSPAGRTDGWNAKRFGWSSTQTVGHAGVIELQNHSASGNIYAELAAYEKNTSIYQDIRTTPGTMLVWRLRHTSLNKDYLDRMSVMIGAPGHETAQQATRVSVNGLGDKTGPVGQTVTRFRFLNVDSRSSTNGNLLDDIVLGRLYPLHYDGNGNTWGSTPEQKQ